MAQSEALQIKSIMAELETVAETVVKTISLEILDRLKEVTPVDTGFAQANWRATFGDFPSRAIGAPGVPGPAQSVQAASEATLLTYTLDRGPVYIGNPTAYIGEIVSPVTATIAISGAVTRLQFQALSFSNLGNLTRITKNPTACAAF